MESADVLLLKRTAEGDAEAFTAFYDQYSPGVFGHLCRLLRLQAAAEDVLQETFCQVWSQAGKFDPTRSSPRAWLFLLARSRAFDYLRKQRSTTGLDVVEDQPAPALPDALESGERVEAIAAALGDLPEEQRRALCLAFYDGMTHEEVAKHQGVPLGTAKTRIRLAMKRLRDWLERSEEPPV